MHFPLNLQASFGLRILSALEAFETLDYLPFRSYKNVIASNRSEE